MTALLLVFPVLLALLVAWELAARVWRRRRALGRDLSPQVDARLADPPENERRRRLDLAASRWPGPARW